MKILIILFFVLNLSVFAQQISLGGKIVDSESLTPLLNANISISTKINVGTASDEDGEFILNPSLNNSDTLVITYVGYKDWKSSVGELLKLSGIEITNGSAYYVFALKKKAIPSQTILVEATIGKKGITPLALDQINGKELEKN